MGIFKKLQEKKETGQYITEDEKRFIERSTQRDEEARQEYEETALSEV